MNIKLAVIIPTYDNLEMLKPLVTQLEGFNVYVIEDGQRKETTNWLKTQRVKSILHTENMGVAVSWNDGLREALKDGCTHFAIINDDVVLPKNWWEDCRKEFENKKVHLVSLNFSGWFFIIDKECVERIGFFDEQFAPFCTEDDDYWERFRQAGLVSASINIDVFHHGSTTLKKLDKNLVKKVRADNWHKFRKKFPNKTMAAL